jgi:peptidoglycan/xylan/chitin deacetylase (PgdA/CDA1 family)
LTSGAGVPGAWVGLTFDDGNSSDHAHALPLLAERGFRATFFVCGRRVDASDGLTRHMVRDLHAGGMHVGSHGMTHRFLTTLSADEERDELAQSRALLESIVGESVDHFAPPGGRWSARTKRLLRELSYRAVSTSAFGFNSDSASRFAYRRIPIVAATRRDRFDAVVDGERRKLLAGYARAAGVSLLRRTLGEGVAARLRSVGAGGPS